MTSEPQAQASPRATDLNDRYWREAERFRDALLRSDVGTRVAKIYLFGSLARGAATEHSDIDLLVVLCDEDNGARAVAETLLDLQLEGCGPLEPVTCSIEDLFPLRDYFLYHVVRHGKEIYAMPEAELRREGARRLLELARQYLEAANDTVERGHLRLGLDGAYNAAELAVKGLLLLGGIEDLPGSHGGLLQRFSEAYIKTGRLEREIGRDLNRALEWRNWARYRYEARLALDEAQLVARLAAQLVTRLADELARPRGRP